MSMPNSSASRVVKTATWIGTTLGRWRRRRASKKDDAFVQVWKSAWQEGCEARLAGAKQDANPKKRNPQKAAWLAGWAWADTMDRAPAATPTTTD